MSTTSNSSAASTTPTIIATSTDRAPGLSSSDSFSFDAGATSTNTALVFFFEDPGGGAPTSASFNGQSLTIRSYNGEYYDSWGYVVNPSPGVHTFTINYPSNSTPLYRVMLLKDVNQTTPYDADGENYGYSVSTCPKTLTTTAANDLLFAEVMGNSSVNPISEGYGQTELWQTQPYGSGYTWWAGASKPATTAGSQTMSFTFNTSNMDLPRFRGEAWRWVSVADWRSWRRPPCGCSSLVRPQRSPFLHPGPCAGSAVAHSPCQARAFCAPARACA